MIKVHLPEVVVLTAAWTAAGCTPMQFRIDPPFRYHGQYYNKEQIRRVAAERCGFSQDVGLPPKLKPFTADGRSMWPDGNPSRFPPRDRCPLGSCPDLPANVLFSDLDCKGFFLREELVRLIHMVHAQP